MSTKIYSGFKFASRHWITVHRQIMAFRRELRDIVRADRAKKMAQEAHLTLDRRAAGVVDPENGQSAYVLASKNNWDEEKLTPVAFKIAVFPYGRRIYGMTFGWMGYEKLWQDKVFVEPWGYWNNTDRPDNLTAKEWRYRRDVWEKILGNDSPSMRGFVADCIDTYDIYVSPEDLLANAPTFDERTRILAADLMFPEYQKEHGGDGLKAFMAFQQWVKKDGLDKFQQECRRVESSLHKEITKEMLMEGGW